MENSKKILKVLKNGEKISENEFLVEKLSIFQLYKLTHFSNNAMAFFLEPTDNKNIKITFKKFDYDKNEKKYKKTFNFINKKTDKFKKNFSINENDLNGAMCFVNNFNDERKHIKDKKSFVFINEDKKISFKIKYNLDHDEY